MTGRLGRSLRLLALAAIVAGCAGPGPTSRSTASVPAGGSFDPGGVGLSLEPLVSGLRDPLALTHAGDGSGRIFVAEQEGAIRVIRDGALVDEPFLDISERIKAGGEQGLLGLAFHPDFPTDPRFFVNYTDTKGDTRVSSFVVDPASPDRADPESEVRLLFIDQPYANHNGGALAFGPDGFLYISTGDGGSGGDPHGNGQSLETLLGKILRIDVDKTEGDNAYAVPADNPFVGEAGALPEIFVYGLRNPWRMSFDRANGDLWIGDVGQSSWEEIDVVRSGTSGQNFGWNLMEGDHCFRPAEGCEKPSLVPPVTEYGRDEGTTVIGGTVYRGSEQPALVGAYVFADFGSRRFWLIDAASDGPSDPVLALEDGPNVASFGEDEAGEIYATALATGEVLKVRAVSR
jgi:glucose/arabinose dehydrogenase